MSSERSIPSAGPDFEHLLAQDVVIEAGDGATRTGAQSIAPDHSPRAPLGAAAGALPRSAIVHAVGAGDAQREVEQFLYRQAELLDGKHWQAFIDLFDDAGVYWMPVTREQTEWEGSPSIFAEDKLMMEIRMGRLSHPNAWSQAAMWGTNHLVGNLVVESVAPDGAVTAYSRFQMMEMRRDQIRHFGGTYRHHLVRTTQGLRIQLQRVDMMNGQAAYDYVLQAWV
jgi:3-phenylpropionate/cinnamic acid dioxygenase small subunit